MPSMRCLGYRSGGQPCPSAATRRSWRGTGRDTVDELAGTDVAVTRWYVATDATSAADAAARLNAAFIGSGVDAATFLATTEDVIGSDVAFIRILEAYLGLGLLIGVAGLFRVMLNSDSVVTPTAGFLTTNAMPSSTVINAWYAISSSSKTISPRSSSAGLRRCAGRVPRASRTAS